MNTQNLASINQLSVFLFCKQTAVNFVPLSKSPHQLDKVQRLKKKGENEGVDEDRHPRHAQQSANLVCALISVIVCVCVCVCVCVFVCVLEILDTNYVPGIVYLNFRHIDWNIPNVGIYVHTCILSCKHSYAQTRTILLHNRKEHTAGRRWFQLRGSKLYQHIAPGWNFQKFF